MLKRHTFEKWLVLSTLLVLSMGCAPSSPSTSTSSTAPPAGILIIERSEPISPGQCYLTVALNQPPNSIDAHVILTAERGIRFMKTDSETSEQITMTLKAGEIREHTFHCRLEEADIQLPGEYVVQAVVLDRISRDILYVTDSSLPISLEEGGRPYFASQEVFDSQFSTGFVNGGGNIQYRLELAQDIYPRGGFLFLKVVSQHDQAAVMVQASVLNGIQFSDPSAGTSTVLLTDSQQHAIRVNFGAIALHGSRIARIPFRIESGIMDGRYLISVVEENGTASWMETAPVFLKVESDLTLVGEQWLAADQMAQAGPTQPAVLLNANVAAYQPLPSATATPLITPPATPTLAPSEPTPDPLPTAMPTTAPTPTSGAAVIQAMNFTWEQPLTAYYGSCRDVYEQRIEGKLPMNWETFRAAVIYYNPDLANTDCMFNPFREYWLPTAATADVVR